MSGKKKMTFTEAMTLVRSGKKVHSLSVFGDSTRYIFMDDGVLSVGDTDNESVVEELIVDTDVLDSVDFYEMSESVTLTAYLDTVKNRWISTTKADEHRSKGHLVKTFVAQE